MKKKIGNLKLILEIFRLNYRFDKKITLYELLHGCCLNFSIVLNILFPAYIVNLLVIGDQWSKAIHISIGYGLMQCVLGCGERCFKLLQESHGFRACNLLRLSMNKKFMRIKYADTESSKVVDAFEKAKDSMWEFTDVGYVIFDDIIGNLITFVCMSYILTEINLWVYLGVLTLVCVNVYIQYKKDEFIHQSEQTEFITKKWINYIAKIMQDYNIGKEVRLFEMDDFLLKKYDHYAALFKEQVKSKEKTCMQMSLAQNIIYTLQMVLVYFLAIYRCIAGTLQIGSFLLYISAIKQLAECIKNIFAAYVELSRVTFYYNDFVDFMKIPEVIAQCGKEHIILREDNEIEFKNVSYCYKNSKEYALRDVSFVIKGNERLGIVGENGAGKSTLIKLLLGLYEPSEGSIYLNGKNIKDYDYREYLNVFNCVFQDFAMFAYSILENIVFDREVEAEKIAEIIKYIGLEQKIQRFNLGIHSLIGKTLSEDGIQLSGGEAQLVAIARAFYHESGVMIFDEPTAALDPLNEAHIFSIINTVSSGKMLVFCAHRMSSTRFCDKILVLDNGYVCESGTHEELMNKFGTYYTLYSKQANLYSG